MSPELSRQRGTIDELHDKVSKVGGVVAGDLTVIEDRYDTRMADGTCRSGFPAEAFAKLVVVGEFGAQELDGDGSPENIVDGTPDLTHSAAGDSLVKPIAVGDERTGRDV